MCWTVLCCALKALQRAAMCAPGAVLKNHERNNHVLCPVETFQCGVEVHFSLPKASPESDMSLCWSTELRVNIYLSSPAIGPHHNKVNSSVDTSKKQAM